MDRFSYHQYDWGDLIYGTKEQLQALGLGNDRPFPGESGAPKRRIRVVDRRGYRCEIHSERSQHGIFAAHVYFPNWPEMPGFEKSAEFPYRGVKKIKYIFWDSYTGRTADLVAAGLVQAEQLPGQVGMRKTCVTIFADGTVAGGPPTANYSRRHEPGARWIRKISTETFEVCVVISGEESDKRRKAYHLERMRWEQTVRALPRPLKLQSVEARYPVARRGHLRLVWSSGATTQH